MKRSARDSLIRNRVPMDSSRFPIPVQSPASAGRAVPSDAAPRETCSLLLGFSAAPPREGFLPDAEGDLSAVADGTNLGREFERIASAAALRDALVTSTRSFSYGDLLHAARRVRDRLRQDLSFRDGDRVCVWLPNGPEYVAAFYGALLAGGVAVPVPPDVEADRLRHVLDVCDVRFVLTSETVVRRRPAAVGDREPLALDAAPGRLLKPRFAESDLVAGAADSPASLPSGDAPAAIFFTSGSTGEPKGVTLSHANLLANARSIREYLGVTADDRALGILPFYHAFGNSVLQTHLLSGATIVVAGSLTFPETILEAVADHGVTSLSGVPDLFRTLLTRTSFGSVRLPTLRYLAVAGGKLDTDQAIELADRAASAKLFVMYGQTEATARLSYLPPDMLRERYGSIGRGIPGVELQVVDENGRPAAVGEVGELRARGPNVMLGYWRDPEGTREVLRDGWLYTGDLATVDADGFVYPQGRRSGLVKIAGYRVHPAELEDFARRELGVLEAAAVAYEPPGLGTRLALFVQPWKIPLTPEEVMSRCVRSLPRHKVPEHVEVLDRFPLNNSYKIDRPGLRRRAERVTAESSSGAVS